MARPARRGLLRSGGIRSAARGLFLGSLGAMAVVAVAAAAVWPLWYLATRHTGLYTALSLLAIGAAVVYALASRAMRRKADDVDRP